MSDCVEVVGWQGQLEKVIALREQSSLGHKVPKCTGS